MITGLKWWDTAPFKAGQFRVLKRGNRGDLVVELQRTLNRVGFKLTDDGDFGAGTEAAVRQYQKQQHLIVDGVFGNVTAARLSKQLKGKDTKGSLTLEDLQRSASELDVPVAVIAAVSEVESRGRGFLACGRPVILYERHIMNRRLVHYGIDPKPWLTSLADIVNTKAGGYKGGSLEYERLATAKSIHEISALESASWGLYQIMGFHWKHLGYSSAFEFVELMHRDEGEHLEAFTRFIRKDPPMHKALLSRDWTEFARRYNGPAFSKNGYDVKMAVAYAKHQKNETFA